MLGLSRILIQNTLKQKKTGRVLYGLFLLSSLGMVFSGCHSSSGEFPNYGKLPSFQLINQDNQAVSLEDYRGKVWVANFIFTSCAGTCPMLTKRMKKVEGAIQGLTKGQEDIPFRIVSFSVDPEQDTPERLKEYAKEYKVDTTLWTFVTGPLGQITQMVVKGFKISMGKVPVGTQGGEATAQEIFEVVHGEKFVLVDQEGNIRGYYDSNSSGIKKLLADMKTLLKKVS